MLYNLSHFIKDKLHFVWNLIEWLNEKLFLLLYSKRVKSISDYLKEHQEDYQIKEANQDKVTSLVAFFAKQPQDSFTYFQPHGFDEKSIRQLVNRKSHLLYLVLDSDNVIVGYFFLRCFFIGKCFLGKMVDYEHQGKGIGQMMCLKAMDIATLLKMRMFETISKDNLSSLYSTQKVLDTKIIKEMENNYIYIEDFPKGTLK